MPLKLSPVDVSGTPSYPARGRRGRSWKRTAAAVGATLVLWLPACGDDSESCPRLTGDDEALRLGGAPPPPDVVADAGTPKPEDQQVETTKPPEIPTEQTRTAGVPTIAQPPPPVAPPNDQVRVPGQATIPLPPSLPPQGVVEAPDAAKPPQLQNPGPPQGDPPRLAGRPRDPRL